MKLIQRVYMTVAKYMKKSTDEDKAKFEQTIMRDTDSLILSLSMKYA